MGGGGYYSLLSPDLASEKDTGCTLGHFVSTYGQDRRLHLVIIQTTFFAMSVVCGLVDNKGKWLTSQRTKKLIFIGLTEKNYNRKVGNVNLRL